MSWTATNVGGVGQYAVYRVEGDSLLPGQPWTPVATVAALPGQQVYALLDTAQLVNGAPYTFFTVALYGDDIQSDPSNLVTILGSTTRRWPATTATPTAEDTTLTQPRRASSATTSDSDTASPLTAALVTGRRTARWP